MIVLEASEAERLRFLTNLPTPRMGYFVRKSKTKRK